MMSKDEKIEKIAEMDCEIFEIDYKISLIQSGLKRGSIKSLRATQERLRENMYSLLREVEIE